jgi:signal transduction histidine kinase
MREWRVWKWAHAHPLVMDVALAAAVAVVSLLFHFHQRDYDGRIYRDPNAATIALVLASCAPLAWRRRAPIPTVLAAVVLQAACEWNAVNGPSWIPVLIATYSLGAYSSGRRRTITAAVVAVIVGLLVLAGLLEDVIELPEVIGAAASLAVPFVVGDNVRRRRNELAELAGRADRAERQRELLAAQRVGEERTRIARDLHDVVAHSVSAIVIQAAAARRSVDRAPADAVELLSNIEETGRRTMSELRQILGVLRETEDAERVTSGPVQSIIDIESLVDSANDLTVRLSTSGAIDTVPSGVATSAFRVVQEALTNARRHAGPNATIDVRVERTDGCLDVCVEDDGRGASADDKHVGYGLIGTSERVATFGGTLRSGPRRSGGWQVRARFPLTLRSPATQAVAGRSLTGARSLALERDDHV